jgi:hypothetical protein
MDINENIPNGIDDLDTSWLDEFDKLDSEYKNYYNEEQLFIRIKFVYININSEIERIKEETYFFRSSNKITRDELISIIKKNTFSTDKSYSLLSILKFAINIEPLQIKSFLKNNSHTNNRDSNFLQSIKNIDDIVFEKSISMFHDINELLILFFEKQPLKHLSNQGCTKKLFINPNTKKYTRRKQFKATQIL